MAITEDLDADCPICFETYSPSSYRNNWKVLASCGHKLCKSCYRTIKGTSGIVLILCPLCRQPEISPQLQIPTPSTLPNENEAVNQSENSSHGNGNTISQRLVDKFFNLKPEELFACYMFILLFLLFLMVTMISLSSHFNWERNMRESIIDKYLRSLITNSNNLTQTELVFNHLIKLIYCTSLEEFSLEELDLKN